MHIQKTSQAVKTTLNICILVAQNGQFVVTRRYILINHIDVANLFTLNIVASKRLLSWAQLEDGMVDHEVRSNLEVEPLSLIEAEVVVVHSDRLLPCAS